MLRRRRDLVGLLAVGSLIALTLYFVPTRAHERYLYGAIALLAPLAIYEPRLRRPFFALSATFFVTLAYVLANSPYRIITFSRLEDFPGWAISLMAAVTTLTGAWVAWRLIGLLRRRLGRGRIRRLGVGWSKTRKGGPPMATTTDLDAALDAARKAGTADRSTASSGDWPSASARA